MEDGIEDLRAETRAQLPAGCYQRTDGLNVWLRCENAATTTVAHATEMIRELAGWLPERSFHHYAV